MSTGEVGSLPAPRFFAGPANSACDSGQYQRRPPGARCSLRWSSTVTKAVPSFCELLCSGQQECSQQGTSWTSLWYVWLILLTVFLLLMCGIGASCAKFCCRTKQPLRQTFPPHGHDLTVIPMEHDSTAHSTVTSYSSLQYPPNASLPLPFGDPERNTACPPAYSLYAIEMPPSYDEAIQMSKPHDETQSANQKPDGGSCEPPTSASERNESPSLPTSSENCPAEVEQNPANDASTSSPEQS